MQYKLIITAREWIGTPRHDGQSSRQGCDCVGFLIGVAKEIGYFPPDFSLSNYSQIARGDSLIEILDKYLEKDYEGVIVALRYSRLITHVGIVDNDKLIHCHFSQGVIIVPFTDYLKRKIVERYSLKSSSWLN